MQILFVPSLGLDVSLLDRLAESVDYHIPWKVVLNNGPLGALEGFARRNRDWIVKEPGNNLGVAGSWNEAAKIFPDESILLMNEDAHFLPGYLEKICSAADHNAGAPLIHLNDSNAYYCFVWTRVGREQFGTFDENFWPAYCLDPDTLILTAELQWRKIGDVHPGQILIGVDEHTSNKMGRKYTSSQVLSTKRRIAPCVRITVDDGRNVICSTDHRWLVRRPSQSDSESGYIWQWKTTNLLRPGFTICSPLRTWWQDQTFRTGWLAGIFDGEGSYQESSKGIAFYQRAGEVLEQGQKILREMGINFSVHSDKTGCHAVHVTTKRDVIELMGRLRPVRLFRQHRRLWDGVLVRSKGVPSGAIIHEIEPMGMREVVSMETTSKTFIANGLVSHNCEDCDMRVRHRIAGVTEYPYALQGLNPLPHGKPRSGGINYSAMLQGAGLFNRAYWLKKWGSVSMESPAYTSPYNDHRLTYKDVVWYPEERAMRHPLWETFMSMPNPSIYE